MNQQTYWCHHCQTYFTHYQQHQNHNCLQSIQHYTNSGTQQQMQMGIPTYITEILNRLDILTNMVREMDIVGRLDALTKMVQELKDKERK